MQAILIAQQHGPVRKGSWSKGGRWMMGDDARPMLPFDRVMAVSSYLDLNLDERLDASRKGITNGTVRHEVPYLTLEKVFSNEDNGRN